jgi:membrane protein implicated in regulation of membrane protease activity
MKTSKWIGLVLGVIGCILLFTELSVYNVIIGFIMVAVGGTMLIGKYEE